MEKSIIPSAVDRSGKKTTINKNVVISEIVDKINVKIFIILNCVVIMGYWLIRKGLSIKLPSAMYCV